ncbi:hypothetical protein [Pectobacterium aroidearum]|uniref:hypothetical protein n=1 Tax=Pectobacterium aroidearum TaxID=1201031 RepID=UPI0021152164|nr:hypothetical protein [Pectobacterium aroidearum]UUE56001.1 hypothetical protein L0Y27_12140 [Pectobacterium aroidearum]UUE68661.1 hypothetical protein L0Y21_12810 [Pectobacterium aroidearum]UUE73027.1 hypothetical protein L0Y20_12915 [Pectobacterium aroidearum]UUE77368.1 hypothetical protein L0Y24_12355 [Pectobacterium aroidearum]
MRDNFTAATKMALARRAAHFCSNPRCLKLTVGPSSVPNKALTTGHAAHIHAASELGPLYKASQTPSERKSIENGIWLCRECGVIVDSDESRYTDDQLRKWKVDHEAMVSEVRTEGYSRSLALLQSGRMEPQIAKKIIVSMEDRRSLWVTFDAEFPDRVRQSLDELRSRFTAIRGDLLDGTPLDGILLSLTKTILTFFNAVESSNLQTLRCNALDPEWCQFNDALATLRKAIGLQIANLADAYGIALSEDLQCIAPLRVELHSST